jgi:hypothetical protein
MTKPQLLRLALLMKRIRHYDASVYVSLKDLW